MPELLLQVLPHGVGLPLPAYATALAAGMDLRAAVMEPLVLAPGERALIPSGLCVAIPAGYEGQVRARSGLALRHGIAVLNAPGTIDADYRGEVGVILLNTSNQPFTIERGLRMAQLIIAPVVQVLPRQVAALPETGRGAGGFGSTGTG